jgi:hypothetical protein
MEQASADHLASWWIGGVVSPAKGVRFFPVPPLAPVYAG